MRRKNRPSLLLLCAPRTSITESITPPPPHTHTALAFRVSRRLLSARSDRSSFDLARRAVSKIPVSFFPLSRPHLLAPSMKTADRAGTLAIGDGSWYSSRRAPSHRRDQNSRRPRVDNHREPVVDPQRGPPDLRPGVHELGSAPASPKRLEAIFHLVLLFLSTRSGFLRSTCPESPGISVEGIGFADESRVSNDRRRITVENP